MASVSYEALVTVKRALQSFQTDVAGAGFSAGNAASNILSECQSSIRQTEDAISAIEDEIRRLSWEIDQAEQQLSACNYEWDRIYHEELPTLYKNIQGTEGQLYQLRGQIRALQAELPGLEDGEAKNQVLSRISALDEERKNAEGYLQQLEAAVAEKERRRKVLQSQIAELKSKLMGMESERATQKNRLGKWQNKLARQKSAFSRVESDLNAYVSAARFFESSSSGAAATSQSAVNRCIESIESYESVIL